MKSKVSKTLRRLSFICFVLMLCGYKKGDILQFQGDSMSFRLEERIGRGGLGDVWRVSSTKTSDEFALKILHKNSSLTSGYSKVMKIEDREDILLDIFYVGELKKTKGKAILSELALIDGSFFHKILSPKHAVDAESAQREIEKLNAIQQLIAILTKGLSKLHENNLIHNDLKFENLIIDKNNKLKISDFDTLTDSNLVNDSIMGTLNFISPEMLFNRPLEPGSDMYSLGLLIFSLLTGDSFLAAGINKYQISWEPEKLGDALKAIYQNFTELSTQVSMVATALTTRLAYIKARWLHEGSFKAFEKVWKRIQAIVSFYLSRGPKDRSYPLSLQDKKGETLSVLLNQYVKKIHCADKIGSELLSGLSHSGNERMLARSLGMLSDKLKDPIAFHDLGEVQGVRYRFTKPFATIQSRLYFLAIVEHLGGRYLRVFYQSKSQGSVRLLPALNLMGDDDLPVYDKGSGEDTLNLPMKIQFKLNQKFAHHSESDVSYKFEFDHNQSILEHAVPVNYTEAEYKDYLRSKDFPNVTSRYLVDQSIPFTEKTARGNIRDPSRVKIKNFRDRPNWASLKKIEDVDASFTRKTEVYIVLSHSSDINYVFFRDPKRLYWLALVEKHRSKVGPFGLYSEAALPEELGMPMWEYKAQLPEEFWGEAHWAHSEYVMTDRYLDEIKMLRNFEEAARKKEFW